MLYKRLAFVQNGGNINSNIFLVTSMTKRVMVGRASASWEMVGARWPKDHETHFRDAFLNFSREGRGQPRYQCQVVSIV